jgi:hypothetical protein
MSLSPSPPAEATPPPVNWTEEMEEVLLKKMKMMSKKHQSGVWWTDASWEIFQEYMNKRRFRPNLSIPQLEDKMQEVRQPFPPPGPFFPNLADNSL